MTRHLDPGRSRPPTFWPFPIDIDTSVCDRCSAMVPATDKAHTQHRDHHRQIDAIEAGLATVALTGQLSGSGSNAGLTKPDSPDPDPNVPTPEQEVTAGRSGVEGANGSQADAGTPPSDVTETPDPASPRRGRSGVANRSRPGGPGDAPTGRLLPLPEPPANHGKWAG